jgi:flagellar biosynthesis anti-sigma factor FlgM
LVDHTKPNDMKIGEQGGVEPRLTPRSVGGEGSDVRSTTETTRGDAGSDTTTVSDVARELSKLIAAGAPEPGDQSGRVAELRAAVASGQYKPALEDVARKLVVDVAAERRR